MIRFLVDVYKVDIPENGIVRDDIDESTEDWLEKLGRAKCYQFQIQGKTYSELAMKLKRHDQ